MASIPQPGTLDVWIMTDEIALEIAIQARRRVALRDLEESEASNKQTQGDTSNDAG